MTFDKFNGFITGVYYFLLSEPTLMNLKRVTIDKVGSIEIRIRCLFVCVLKKQSWFESDDSCLLGLTTDTLMATHDIIE